MADGHEDDCCAPVALDVFETDSTSVTNDDFARFVDATGHLTEAETFGYVSQRSSAGSTASAAIPSAAGGAA